MALALLALGIVVVTPWLLVGLVMPSLHAPGPLPTERSLATAEGNWRYEDVGEGDSALLLLHGFNQGLDQWDGVWAKLSACGQRRIRVDLPGFAGSRFGSDDFSLPRQAERLLAFLDARGIHKATLAGSSMGGSLAAWFAAKHPERVSQMALFAPSGYTQALTYSGMFGVLVQPGRLNHAATWIARTKPFSLLFPQSAAVQALTVTASYGAPWMEALSQIRAPTLLVWARVDPVASASTAASVARMIPNSTLLWLDASAGHSPPNTQPERVASLLCRLAKGSPPAEVASL